MSASLKASLVVATLVVFMFLGSPGAQAPQVPAGSGAPGANLATERVDLDAIYKIKEEGLERSQVMDTLWYLTEVYGPRLTNSPNIRAAAAWATARMGEWGLTHPRQEVWGQFGRGWVEREVHRQRRDAATVPAHRVCHGRGRPERAAP